MIVNGAINEALVLKADLPEADTVLIMYIIVDVDEGEQSRACQLKVGWNCIC